jgi:hypothetical protein
MKRHAFVTALLGLVLTPALAPLYGQSIKVEIPFDFVAEKATLPAGEYSVSRNQPAQGMVRLVNSKGQGAMCLAGGIQANRPSNTTKLVFNRYGSHYFLSQVWAQGNDRGHLLKPSKAEREIARTFKPGTEILTASTK